MTQRSASNTCYCMRIHEHQPFRWLVRLAPDSERVMVRSGLNVQVAGLGTVIQGWAHVKTQPLLPPPHSDTGHATPDDGSPQAGLPSSPGTFSSAALSSEHPFLFGQCKVCKILLWCFLSGWPTNLLWPPQMSKMDAAGPSGDQNQGRGLRE